MEQPPQFEAMLTPRSPLGVVATHTRCHFRTSEPGMVLVWLKLPGRWPVRRMSWPVWVVRLTVVERDRVALWHGEPVTTGDQWAEPCTTAATTSGPSDKLFPWSSHFGWMSMPGGDSIMAERWSNLRAGDTWLR